MYYIILLLAVMTFLTLVALRFPDRAMLEGAGGPAGSTGAGSRAAAGETKTAPDTVRERVAQALKGEWTEERPCLTPIDCVADHRCDGHCGRH